MALHASPRILISTEHLSLLHLLNIPTTYSWPLQSPSSQSKLTVLTLLISCSAPWVSFPGTAVTTTRWRLVFIVINHIYFKNTTKLVKYLGRGLLNGCPQLTIEVPMSSVRGSGTVSDPTKGKRGWKSFNNTLCVERVPLGCPFGCHFPSIYRQPTTGT